MLLITDVLRIIPQFSFCATGLPVAYTSDFLGEITMFL